MFVMIDQDLHKASLDTSTEAQLRTAYGNNCVGQSVVGSGYCLLWPW